jgi:hypothetical protein
MHAHSIREVQGTFSIPRLLLGSTDCFLHINTRSQDAFANSHLRWTLCLRKQPDRKRQRPLEKEVTLSSTHNTHCSKPSSRYICTRWVVLLFSSTHQSNNHHHDVRHQLSPRRLRAQLKPSIPSPPSLYRGRGPRCSSIWYPGRIRETTPQAP